MSKNKVIVQLQHDGTMLFKVGKNASTWYIIKIKTNENGVRRFSSISGNITGINTTKSMEKPFIY